MESKSLDNSALLTMHGVRKGYTLASEEVIALEDVHLEVRPQDFLAITGPSGSGKTTLLNLLAGLDRPSEGTVYWQDQELNRLNERALARWRLNSIGMVFQDACLISGLDVTGNTILPQVLEGGQTDSSEARVLLDRFGMGSKLHRLPRQLSRGEKQRVAIARALVNKPTCLLADEPTGNLDRKATLEAFRLLKELNESDGLTLVVATHDESISDFATRHLILDDGRVSQELAL